MSKKSVVYDFKTAYRCITPEILGFLRFLDVDVLIVMTKMHMIAYPYEMLIFFEALRAAMETYYPKDRVQARKKIDFFGQFDYKVQAADPSRELNGEIHPFMIIFEFYSVIGYGIRTTVYFDFDGKFFVLGRKVDTEWTVL